MGADISAQGSTDGSLGDPAADAGAQWFFGPRRDLLLGCGLAYVGIFVVLGFAGAPLQTIALTAVASVVIFAFGTLETEYGGPCASAAGDTARVELAAQRLRAIGWDSSALRLNAALLRARDGDLENALVHAERARALFPTDDVWRMLGFVNQQLKRRDDAIVATRRALAARPAWAEVENKLAWLIATAEGSQYDANEAVRLAQSVSRQFGIQNANALDTLAVAHASAGRFPRASEIAQHAARRARDTGDEQLALQIEQRRALYRSARPYREP